MYYFGAAGYIRSSLPLAVAFSGGPDSLCVLFLLRQYFESIGRDSSSLVSFTINHGLQTASDSMTEQCRKLSEALGIPNVALSIPWSRAPFPPRPREGNAIELTAREARSQLLFDAMNEYGCDTLVLGHHADDQVETLLYRMLHQKVLSWHSDMSFAGMRSLRRWGMGLGNSPGCLAWAGLPGMSKWMVRPLLTKSKV